MKNVIKFSFALFLILFSFFPVVSADATLFDLSHKDNYSIPEIKLENTIKDSIEFRKQFGMEVNEGYIKNLVIFKKDNYKYGVALTKEEENMLDDRIDFQEKTIPLIHKFVEDEDLKESFSGIYIDQVNGGTINVGFTGDVTDRIEESINQLGGKSSKYEINLFKSKYTLEELEKAQKDIEDKLSLILESRVDKGNPVIQSSEGDIKISHTSLDIVNQRIEIGIKPFNKVNAEYIKNYFNFDSINVVPFHESSDHSSELDGRKLYHRPLSGGLEIKNAAGNSGPCSGGFSARNSSNQYFYITAGHCAKLNDNMTQGGTAFGTTTRSVYGGSTDAAAIRLYNSTHRSFYIYAGTNTGRKIWDVSSPTNNQGNTVGSVICISGKSSGLSCGTLTDTSYAYTVTETNTRFTNMKRGTYTSVSGDSGGPIYSTFGNDHAILVGVNKGRSGGRSVYTYVQNALSDLRMSNAIIER